MSLAPGDQRISAHRKRDVKGPRGRLSTRLVQGPLLLGVIVVAAALAVASVSLVETSIRRRAVAQQLLTAKIVISLSVDHNLTQAEFTKNTLDPKNLVDLDADVQVLRRRGEIVGLEVWDANGSLLYGDAGHPIEETRLPSHQLRRVRTGEPYVVTVDDTGRGVALLEVIRPMDLDRDGRVDGVVEVLLPQSKVDAAVASSATRLRFGAAVAVALVGLLLLEMRRRLRRGHYQAEHDPLTGLGNRALLARRGGSLLRREERQPSLARSDAALLLIDLDGFKRVNDALGHSVGDDVLIVVAARLRSVMRADEELVRLGGDEFAVLLAPVEADDAGDRLAERILEALREPVAVGPVYVQIGASIGIALRDGDLDLGELLRRADVAMYQAKRHAGGYLRYTRDTDDNDADHLALLGDVQQALAHDELFLDYQPKVGPAWELVGAEALVRWMHPTRGLLAPGDFLPLVEETALMKPLTAWVLQRALAQTATWRARGLDVPVAVNVSPRTMLDAAFVPNLEEALVANGLPGSSLTVEITETAIIEDPDRARQVIHELRARGVGVSIDDFGTGFTSLAYLKALPISEIKIDQGFVGGLLDGGADRAIVAYTIGLAHDLGVPVVAEGVESVEVLDELRALGCDSFQGYLFARPLGVDDFDRWVVVHARRAEAELLALGARSEFGS